MHPVTNYAEKCVKRMPRLEDGGDYSGGSFNTRADGWKGGERRQRRSERDGERRFV